MPSLISTCFSGIAALAAATALASTATVRNPTHTFSTPGTKVVELTVCNSRGCSTTRKTLTVLDPRPKIASIAIPALVGSAETTATLSAVASGKPALRFAWRLSGRWGSETLAGNLAAWRPDALGSHTVRLTVSNNSGQITSAPASLLVVPSSFADVSPVSPAFDAVETLAALGFTTGCEAGRFCPQDPVSRAQAAVFLSHGLAAQAPPPQPPSASPFADVPLTHWAFQAIHHLYLLGIAEPCGTEPLRFCPEAMLLRSEAAVLLVRSRHGGQFVPPAAMGLFADVSPGLPAAPYIEQLARDGITSGCAPALFCPAEAVSRSAMAAFLVPTFNLVAQPQPTRFALGLAGAPTRYAAGLPLPVALLFTRGLPTSYEYDWDGNGTFEEISRVPIASHVYARPGLFRPAVRLRRGGVVHALSAETALTITSPNFFLTPARPAGVTGRFLRQVDPTPADPPGTLARSAFALQGSAPNALGYLAYLSFDRLTYAFLAMLPADLTAVELLTPRLGAGRTATLVLRAFNAYGSGPASLPVQLTVP
jgi:hypothetical protein